MTQNHVIVGIFLAALCLLSSAEEDYQQWSVQTYLDVETSFMCNNTIYPVFINGDDKLTWRRHGHDSDIENDAHFTLRPVAGVENMELVIKKVTDDMAGIYFCEIRSASDVYVGRIVKGLNVGVRKYSDGMDKYRTNIITGVITGASVFAFVVGICALDHFRYQSEDERREKREAKEQRLHRQVEIKNEAYDNAGFDTSVRNGPEKNGFSGDAGFDIVNTHM